MHSSQRAKSISNTLINPVIEGLENKKITQKKLEKGIKKTIGTTEISYLFVKYMNRKVSKCFHHWKSLMNQEKIIEEFETQGGIRSHQEVYVHNILIKATRNIFRFYSRKKTDFFYRWKYSLLNSKQISYHEVLEKKWNHLRKAVEDKQKKLYNTRKQLDKYVEKSNFTQNHLQKDLYTLKLKIFSKNLLKVLTKPKKEAFQRIFRKSEKIDFKKKVTLASVINKVNFCVIMDSES